MSSIERPGWLDPFDAAKAIGIPLRELYRLIDQGEVPAFKFGNRIALKVEDVEAARRHAGPPTTP